MKNIITRLALLTLLVAASVSSNATVFFNDTFVTGSTLTNTTPTAPTATSTSYQISSSKAVTTTNAFPGYLKYGIATTTGGGVEVQALFTGTPVALAEIGDYVQMTVVFTNEAGLLTANGAMGFGLFNGGQVQPVAGGVINNALMTSTDHVTDGVRNWLGYWGQLAFTGANSRILTRPAQTTGTDNRNQNLTSTGSGSQSYAGPTGATVGTQSATPSVTLSAGATYTVVFRIELTAASTLAITNTLYSGPNTNGAPLSQFGGVASGGTFITGTFDAMAIGWRAQANTAGGTTINISSIKVDGVSTVITAPPDIVTQPVGVSVTSGGSCIYTVTAQGFGMTYQWKRYGTNLVNGGNISGATSDTLTISPASAADVASGANGYFVRVTGTGGYSTNSATNSLSLRAPVNLTWNAASGNVWDLNNTASWQNDSAVTTVFNYGDPVTFDDTSGIRLINLTGKYLAAASVTVNNSLPYTFLAASTGGFAGPGQLIYKGAGQFTIANANTYSGGTVISDAATLLVVQNYAGLGSGPITLAKAGGMMQVTPTGSATLGINGDIIVNQDFTIQFDGTGSFGGVVFGNLSGTAGKTLTFSPGAAGTTNRYRFYGDNTVCNANIALNGTATAQAVYDGTVMAAYNGSGSQTYNGVISGNGGLVQRANGTTVLNGQNTYAGGTVPTTGTIGIGASSTPTVGSVTSGPIGVGALLLSPEIPNATGSGTILALGGARTIGNAIQYPSATNNQTLIIGGTNDITFTGPLTLNGNDSTGTQTNRTLQITNTALTTFSGVISGAGFGITKTGNGILALSNTETYDGPTAVSNGTLRVNGQLAAGAVTVVTNAALGGTGTIGGPVTVLAGGSILPGASVGTLTINNNLSIAGNLGIEINKSLGTPNDKVIVSGTLANTGVGTLAVTNLGSALVQGDSFAIFNKAVTGGAAITVTGAGVTWTNKLAVDGTIAVAATVPTTPTNLTYVVAGNILTLSWPANYQGWLVQSNTAGVAATANWFTVPNSASVTTLNITIDKTKPNVFYRMVAP